MKQKAGDTLVTLLNLLLGYGDQHDARAEQRL